MVTAGLAGNAVTNSLPGGDAAGAAVQFSMLTVAGFDADAGAGGVTAFCLLGVGWLLAALRATGASPQPSLVLLACAAIGIIAMVLLLTGALITHRRALDSAKEMAPALLALAYLAIALTS
ncbi:MAG: hypothetical protein ACLQDY_27220 [Streptosporangiaceae bacterium]